MNKFGLLICLLLLGSSVTAQSEQYANNQEEFKTIFSNKRSNGGYGALSVAYSEIDNKDAIIVGARGGWIINHSLAIGLGGYGFANDINYDNLFNDNRDYNLAGGYGGLFVEPIIGPKLPVHISIPILFGFGGVSYVEHHNNWDYWWSTDDKSDVYFVFEPAIELEFNVTRHFRLAATASYRFTSDIEMLYTDPDILEGLTAGLVFKFGKF
ncbi:hypothetical protein [Sunxiuqinia elliptica]|uniref:Outer membrane protein beta-barrel domain-containing protein n=1 Tax=Sunxiuqinia elliptica TaxID=655355 RepID=A0A4R6GNL4_9BACT|nr:hypothetical protein [Sunxiuqinia elliptica]TDN96716.1 hypothetical protein DET52_11186 [Sunxiuqinia elliptica]TDO55725.1 hypothetical protein DET65_4263 [Sunxiuqinia elliptica]